MALEDVATDPFCGQWPVAKRGFLYRGDPKAMNLPSSMFAVVTAVGRTVGWVAHWNEMHERR